MATAHIVSIDDYQPSTTSLRAPTPHHPVVAGTHRATIEHSTNIRSEKYIVLGPTELYPFAEIEDATLFQSLGILGECLSSLENAIKINVEADYIGFDEEMMKARASLRKLFSLRSIGDGFAAVVNGCLWALKNKNADVVTRRQLSALISALSDLKRKPLMHFDTAMSLLDEVEEVDLVVEPENLIDLFGNEA